jgi:hypothetical protein
LGCAGFFGKFLICHSEELCDDAGAIFLDFDFGRERAVDGIEGDLFDWRSFDRPAAAGQDFREVEAGDLEAVEKQAGTAGINVVGGDAADHFANGLLDGAAVFG